MIDRQVLENLPDLYFTEKMNDPEVKLKLYHPYTKWEWYLLECSKEKSTHGLICFALVKGDYYTEIGYVDILELEANGVRIDKDFEAKPISKVREELNETI